LSEKFYFHLRYINDFEIFPRENTGPSNMEKKIIGINKETFQPVKTENNANISSSTRSSSVQKEETHKIE